VTGLFRNADVIGLYLLLAFGLLSPIASNTVLPVAPDHANHTAFIVQAKQAIEEGQFPLRVAPFQHEGLRYPVFQFYSSTPYWIGGLIYKYFTPGNPWVALKTVYLLGLWLAGIFTFKTGRILGFDKATSTLMGVVYMTSPYILINIHPRGAYTEAFAQFVLPLLAYASIRLAQRPAGLSYVWAALAWLLFGTCHIITFVYGTAFYLALVVLCYLFRAIRFRTTAVLLFACLLGWCVSAYQWFPAATTPPLGIHSQLGDIFATNWLTPFSMLLSLTATSPEPLGRDTTPLLYPSLGVPVLVAVGGILYFRRRIKPVEASVIWPLLIVFSVAFFCTWSPIDFWKYLPEQLRLAQFSYRFLTYISAAGVVLFGCFATIYGRSYGPPSFLGWLVCLILLAQPYLPTMPRNARSLESLIATPDVGYGAAAYLYAGKVADTYENEVGKYETRLPLVYADGWLMLGSQFDIDRQYFKRPGVYLRLQGTAEASSRPCERLDLTLNGAAIASVNVKPGLFEWRVPGSAFPFNRAVGQMAFQSDCGFVPSEVDPHSADNRRLWIRVRSLEFRSPGESTSTVTAVRPFCRIVAASVTCDVARPNAGELQLPMLFYPSLLDVRVNGGRVQYSPSYYGPFILAAVPLQAGHSTVSAAFVGSWLGNALSWAGILTAVVAAFVTGDKRRSSLPIPGARNR
jgi:hypothetical protein